MRDDRPENDPGQIWRNQPTEPSAMTLEKIRQKVREHHAKERRQLLGTLAGPLAVAFCYVFCIKEFASLAPWLHPLFAFALAWSLAGLYSLTRGKWSEAMPGDAGFSAGLAFCRREIERRRDYFRRVLLWSFGPVLLALGTMIRGAGDSRRPADPSQCDALPDDGGRVDRRLLRDPGAGTAPTST